MVHHVIGGGSEREIVIDDDRRPLDQLLNALLAGMFRIEQLSARNHPQQPADFIKHRKSLMAGADTRRGDPRTHGFECVIAAQ